MSWRTLVEAFCWAHFGERGKPGASVYWTDDKYNQLLRDVYQIKKQGKATTDKGACDAVLKTFSKNYRGISTERLRKALREARDLYYNRRLAKPVYMAMASDTKAREKKGEHARSARDAKDFLRTLSRIEADRIAER